MQTAGAVGPEFQLIGNHAIAVPMIRPRHLHARESRLEIGQALVQFTPRGEGLRLK